MTISPCLARLPSFFAGDPTPLRYNTNDMKPEPPFRRARKEDCAKIAELFSIASDGVADYIWTTLGEPGLTPLEFGAKRYAREPVESPFSYRNCIVVELDGQVAGMLVSFVMPEEEPAPEKAEAEPAPEPGEPDVLAPYSELETPGSYYVCAMALFPEYRGRGLGTGLLEIVRELAREADCTELSLIVFEQNEAAVRLYQRHGYKVADRRAVVPHPLIHYTGDALLMTAPV
jgi:ribosomal protein S18 acetylase RimI-like enzyme